MTCCGEKREQLRTQTLHQRANESNAVNGRVVFEYTGGASAVVKGAVTGRGYAFLGYGSRVAVDARDAASLAGLPYLQRVLR